MSTDRLNRITALSDEVKDFHPLLDILLRRLPHVTNVEYRQGAREMGADFVLEKTDQTLLTIEYVGVIVKTGKILQSHAEVERQIEECELERTFGGGTRKIFISELWVISNDNISQGAQDKINHKYKNKSIKFIPGEKVLDLVDRFYPEYWTDLSVKIGEYFREVQEKAALLSAGSGMLGPVNDRVYIEQSLVLAPTSKDYRQKRKTKIVRRTAEEAVKDSRFVVVEASMGTGKSTMLAAAATRLAKSDVFNTSNQMPILTTVKEVKSEFGGDLLKLVERVAKKTEVQESKFTILLDGLDEMNMNAEEQVELVQSFKTAVNSDSRVSLLIATRPLAIETDQLIEKEFTKYNLSPFTVKQVIALVDALCKSEVVRNRLTKELEKSGLFKALPKTPISALLLAKLLQENVHEIPSTMTELYSKYMELVLGRWDMSKGLQSQTEYEVIFHVTINLSKYIIDNSLETLSVAEARDMFGNYVDSRNLKIDPETTFSKLLSREVFVISPDGGLMSFRHRTFAEYFYAASLDRDGMNSLSPKLFEYYWATIYFFYFGIKRDAAALIEEASQLQLNDMTERFGRLWVMPNMMLAAYLTPYAVTTAAVKRYFEDATNFYIESILRKDENLPFNKFSDLDILCIFTRVTSSNFAYEFFESALHECAQDVYSKPSLSEDSDLAQLFFLNSALASLGDKKAYDTLISDYGSSMPLAMRIGVVEHSDEAGLKSDAIIRYGKKLHKAFKTNPAMIKDLKAISAGHVIDSLKA